MEDKIILYKSSSYDKSKLKTYSTRSFPKNDGSGRWIVEYYAIFADGTSILTRACECDEERVNLVEFLLER